METSDPAPVLSGPLTVAVAGRTVSGARSKEFSFLAGDVADFGLPGIGKGSNPGGASVLGVGIVAVILVLSAVGDDGDVVAAVIGSGPLHGEMRARHDFVRSADTGRDRCHLDIDPAQNFQGSAGHVERTSWGAGRNCGQ